MLRLIPVVLLLVNGLAAAEQSAIPGPSPASLEADFAAILTEEGIPGGAFVVVRDGVVSQVSTFGVRRSGESAPVSPDTVFRLASVSKTFAAQLTGMLVHEGALGWDDPVVQFVPGFRLRNPFLVSDKTQHVILNGADQRHWLNGKRVVVPRSWESPLGFPVDR